MYFDDALLYAVAGEQGAEGGFECFDLVPCGECGGDHSFGCMMFVVEAPHTQGFDVGDAGRAATSAFKAL